MWGDALQAHFESRKQNGQIILKVCPYCQNANWNIEFSIEKEVFHCWICNFSGAVKSFFKEYGISYENEGWKLSSVAEKFVEIDNLDLSEFSSLNYSDFPKVLSAKGINAEDVKRYNLLYAKFGKFKEKLIIPLYECKKLVYALARDLTIKGRYYNFKVEKKDILPYYMGVENKFEIYLCEGVLDAISVNKLGFTSGVLLGNHLAKNQIERIKKFGFDVAIVCLDGDIKRKAVQMYDLLGKEGIKTKIVLLDDKEDPNDLYVRDKALLKRYLLDAKKLTLEDRVKIEMAK